MGFRHLILSISLAGLFASPSFASSENCTATAGERGAFVGRQMLAELDKGRNKTGAMSGWAEAYIRDPEAHGDALARYCDLYPSASLKTALEQAFGREHTAWAK